MVEKFVGGPNEPVKSRGLPRLGSLTLSARIGMSSFSVFEHPQCKADVLHQPFRKL